MVKNGSKPEFKRSYLEKIEKFQSDRIRNSSFGSKEASGNRIESGIGIGIWKKLQK